MLFPRAALATSLIALMLSQSFSGTVLANTSTGGIVTSSEVHPDLDAELVVPDSQAMLVLADDLIRDMEERQIEEVDPAVASIPEFKPSIAIAQKHISEAVLGYFDALQEIDREVSKLYSKLHSIASIGVRTRDEDIRRDGEAWIRANETPKTQAKIQALYTNALKNLYTMNGSLNILVKKNKNQLNEKSNRSDLGSLFSLCRTQFCVRILAREVEGYFGFIEQLNRGVDFDGIKDEVISTTVKYHAPGIVSGAMLAKAAEIAKMGPSANRRYTSAGLALKYLKDVLIDVPVAGSMAVASVPVKVFENLAKFRKVRLAGITKVSLDIKALGAATSASIAKALTEQALQRAQHLPPVFFQESAPVVQTQAQQTLQQTTLPATANTAENIVAVSSMTETSLEFDMIVPEGLKGNAKRVYTKEICSLASAIVDDLTLPLLNFKPSEKYTRTIAYPQGNAVGVRSFSYEENQDRCKISWSSSQWFAPAMVNFTIIRLAASTKNYSSLESVFSELSSDRFKSNGREVMGQLISQNAMRAIDGMAMLLGKKGIHYNLSEPVKVSARLSYNGGEYSYGMFGRFEVTDRDLNFNTGREIVYLNYNLD
jgi:hypothetical protein